MVGRHHVEEDASHPFKHSLDLTPSFDPFTPSSTTPPNHQTSCQRKIWLKLPFNHPVAPPYRKQRKTPTQLPSPLTHAHTHTHAHAPPPPPPGPPPGPPPMHSSVSPITQTSTSTLSHSRAIWWEKRFRSMVFNSHTRELQPLT